MQSCWLDNDERGAREGLWLQQPRGPRFVHRAHPPAILNRGDSLRMEGLTTSDKPLSSQQDCISLALRAPYGTLHTSEAPCPNVQPRAHAHARLTGLTRQADALRAVCYGNVCRLATNPLARLCLAPCRARSARRGSEAAATPGNKSP